MSQEIDSRVNLAEKEVNACLNYGGVFHNGGPTSKELELAYELGDLTDEIPQMRRFSAALSKLADALEAKGGQLSENTLNERLHYLALRLEHVGQGECLEAAKLLRKALTSHETSLQHPEAEHALFHAIWDHLTNALDHADFDPAHEQKVVALESEMAGRVLNYRLARGWLKRTESAPTGFRSINEFL